VRHADGVRLAALIPRPEREHVALLVGQCDFLSGGATLVLAGGSAITLLDAGL
jgi:hypothetical protein